MQNFVSDTSVIVASSDLDYIKIAYELIILAKSCLAMSDMDDMTKAHFKHELDKIIKEIESEVKDV